MGIEEVEPLHVPRGGGTTLRAQTAVHAQVLVLHHDPFGLGKDLGHEEGLIRIVRRGGQPLAKVYRYVAPFFLLQLCAVLLITYVPWFSTVLLPWFDTLLVGG